ncbi:LysM peptidoglycan-binding domain-containing protein [Desulfoprunum benzoelyticum]|uniref:Membrane-bound lytic murein transglycosylase D n=1 Tax=Desulfoprunum benzoelyticum TaxID=1506996 RepID=A0A840UPR9_9BACT|nr:LysM peptidoglycan-binding domain-containing protein [Desulfoprunum benzoelyticum]MBB5347772.1 membrane-bound lytic murein transglycosylase D [Desulfoprunum benzoelyticum]MBM9529363.1 LysM peptidoglycan-binding domain-containing protein [Desulfoprunum benzoelyticum]
MFYKHLEQFHLLLVLLFALSLTGCASESRLNPLSDPSSSLSSDRRNADGSEDPDLSLEDVEAQGSLEQEMAALRQTGMWDSETSPVTQRDKERSIDTFPLVMNKQVEMYLNLFQTRHRKIYESWLSRSSIYLSLMEKELKNAGLPRELIYLSMIESGYNQRACSPANAVGLWQFIDGTARQYNLDINTFVDERRDAEKSTKAAAAFLSELYREFGDWHLAVAAYNAGAGKIGRGLTKYNVSSFWELAREDYLALETKRYVPKLIAAIIIGKNPEKYGFTKVQKFRPLQYATMKVPPGLSLDALAVVCNTSVKEIKFLNQELRQGKTPPNRPDYEAKIPVAAQEIAGRNISRLHSVVTTGFKSYRIKRGDTLSSICSTYGINKTTLLKVNNLRSKKLTRGQYLRIPYNTVSYQILPEGSKMALAANKSNLILHRVKAGEHISKIASRYNVTPQMIASWNGLSSVNKISVGQQLALYPADRTITTIPGAVTIASLEDDEIGTASAPRSGSDTVRVLTADKKKMSHQPTTVAASSRKNGAIAHAQNKTSVRGARIHTAQTISAQTVQKNISSAQTSRTLSSSTGKTVLANSLKKKSNGNRVKLKDSYSLYQVKDGDTLWTISKKFNVSSVHIKEWNNLKSNVIHPGSQLKVKGV